MANSLTYADQVFRVGDTIAVYQKIVEDQKTRLQVFEGILMAVTGKGTGQAFRVRKLSHMAIGVERIWPVHTPMIAKIVLKKDSAEEGLAKADPDVCTSPEVVAVSEDLARACGLKDFKPTVSAIFELIRQAEDYLWDEELKPLSA